MLNEEELRDAALLVFANKQDQPGAKGAGEISEALRLGELRDRNWSIVACSAVDGSGVHEGMDWLVVSHCPIPIFLSSLVVHWPTKLRDYTKALHSKRYRRTKRPFTLTQSILYNTIINRINIKRRQDLYWAIPTLCFLVSHPRRLG